jgi:hypothetical protein
MGARKIPADAFEVYVSLGAGRSYTAIADRFQVNKRSVTALAKREDWQGRIAALEKKAKDALDQKAAETIEAMKGRHLAVYQALQRKALEALKMKSLDSAMDAVRALDVALEGERLVRGEPTERTAVEIEAKIRREHEMLVLKPGEKDDWSDLEHPAG